VSIVLWTIGLLGVAFWVVGLLAHFATGGVIGGLLFLAVVVVLFRLVQARRLTSVDGGMHDAGTLEDR
jgi:hypothetical protein